MKTSARYLFVLASVVFSPLAIAQEAFICGSSNEFQSKVSGFEECAELSSVRGGVLRPVDLALGGFEAKVPEVQPVELTRFFDANSYVFQEAVFLPPPGNTQWDIKLSCPSAEGPIEYLRISLSDVQVAGLETSLGGGDDVPFESITLAFSKIRYTFFTSPQGICGPDGLVKEIRFIEYDLVDGQVSKG